MDKRELLIDRLQSARKWTLNLLESIDEEHWFRMPDFGTGHVAWQVGHLASSQVALIHVRCFGLDYESVLPAEVRTLFGKGSTPNADPSANPPIQQIRETFNCVHDDCIERIAGLSDEELAKPAGTEPHPLFSSKEGAIGTAALHETFHAGQIAMLRRWFGQAPLR